MRRDVDQARRRDGKQPRKSLAKSTDCILLLLCLAAIGAGGSDERLVNGVRLFAALIQRHARHCAESAAGSARDTEAAARPHGPLMQIK